MSEEFSILINGSPATVPLGTSVAVALSIAGQPCRISVSGEPRAPLCGMGICFECRAVINGNPHSRSCQILCQPGMDIRTHE